MKESIRAISAITEIELLCWKTATNKDINVLKNSITDSFVFELEQDVKNRTVEIRKVYGIKLPDAIIAPTVLVNGLTLISRNTKDFDKIEGLELIKIILKQLGMM